MDWFSQDSIHSRNTTKVTFYSLIFHHNRIEEMLAKCLVVEKLNLSAPAEIFCEGIWGNFHDSEDNGTIALTNLNQLPLANNGKSGALEEAKFSLYYFGCWIYSEGEYKTDAD